MTKPRHLLMAMPPAAVCDSLLDMLARTGLYTRLGSAMFDPANWHQSLSDRFWNGRDSEERLLRAGDLLSAHAVRMRFNRIVGAAQEGPIHWAVRTSGTPAGFVELLKAVRVALEKVGIVDNSNNTSHLTISYNAPAPLAAIPIEPAIEWLIDRVLLVEGLFDGTKYRYRVVKGWDLLPERQLSLFE
ncbi:hypothetical protein [Roseateles sp. P5_E7]